jgi:hypothetical protein
MTSVWPSLARRAGENVTRGVAEMLRTMPDLTWTVRVDRFTWIYTFSRRGTVSWRDPFNGAHGNGSWRIEGEKLIVRWPSGSRDEWDVPINPSYATGTCYMEEGTYDLWAEAQNYYVKPGDVVTVADKKYVIYPDEVRSGGTVAWICRNPGNIRDGDKYGAYKGKKFQTKSVGAFAIFPDEATGMRAIVSVLKGYGHVTILQAMNKYAPPGDGANDPTQYGRAVARRLGKSLDTYIDTLDGSELEEFADQIKTVEGWKEGETFSRESGELPLELRQRFERSYTPTAEEIQNSSLTPRPSW